MYDPATRKGRPLNSSGLRTTSSGTLVDRALRFLAGGPHHSTTLAQDVLGLAHANRAVSDRVIVALLGADPRIRRLGDGRWSLIREAGGSPKLDACTFAVVDVETTGHQPTRGGRITEIAVVTFSSGSVELAFESLVDPEQPLPHFVTRLTGIRDEMVRGRPTFGEIADDVIAALAGRVFVAHNARYDWAFVSREIRRARDVDLEGPRICTRNLARRLIPGLRSRGLDSVTNYFGVEVTQRHRAGGDAMATARVLGRLLEAAAERGAVTLADLEHLAQRRRRRKTKLPTSVDEI